MKKTFAIGLVAVLVLAAVGMLAGCSSENVTGQATFLQRIFGIKQVSPDLVAEGKESGLVDGGKEYSLLGKKPISACGTEIRLANVFPDRAIIEVNGVMETIDKGETITTKGGNKLKLDSLITRAELTESLATIKVQCGEGLGTEEVTKKSKETEVPFVLTEGCEVVEHMSQEIAKTGNEICEETGKSCVFVDKREATSRYREIDGETACSGEPDYSYTHFVMTGCDEPLKFSSFCQTMLQASGMDWPGYIRTSRGNINYVLCC